jgi:hypothetical protein
VAATATVRVTPDTRERLHRLGAQRGLRTPEVIEQLARRAEEDQLLAEHGTAMARIMADPKAAAEYRAEIRAWDGTLQDGLEGL